MFQNSAWVITDWSWSDFSKYLVSNNVFPCLARLYFRITVLFHRFQDSPSLCSYIRHEQNVQLYVKISYVLLNWGKAKWEPSFLVIFYFACFMFLLKLAHSFPAALNQSWARPATENTRFPFCPLPHIFYHVFVNCGNCLAAQKVGITRAPEEKMSIW